MSEPIKSQRINDLASAPTPQNTPASAGSSYLASRAAGGKPAVATISEEDSAAAASAFANNPALMSMIQGKLGSLVGKPSGYIESLPKAVKKRITGLKGLQRDQFELETQFQQELAQLEKKFLALYQPLYEKRSQVIKGDVEPTEQDLENGKLFEEERKAEFADFESDEEESRIEEIEDEEQEQGEEQELLVGIPEFWLTALRNFPNFSESITERDEQALRNLVDIRMSYLDKPGFRLEFEFTPNMFFTNTVLTKTYYYREEIAYGGDYLYSHAEGDVINWTSPELNLTISIQKRKQRNKHTKQTRTIEKTLPVDSFFNFFSPPKVPVLDSDQEEEDLNEEDFPEDLEERLEVDYQLGEEIKEKLIPRAVDWFTGDALQYDNMEEFDGDEFEGDSDDSDEEEDDDSDSDSDGDEGASSQAGAKKETECKQS
ncbi:NAP-domain-containing protein [Nadsonia fulvescens var. elongata DSM 6958]|uniref:NAP-domain-containing protein n=1 Tax=Nadsonia fulvescens var. elongata DSM 6958 TaxID=857566 RepID=A0A1E3PI36_9ASCO|nr:NAP-domain-containing protein [Nadsonia fulvescens var. elongata DSM 6958]